MGGTALAIFTGIIIAAVSSWITVQLSLRKFRTEKWWEQKVEAYTKIIEALHNSKAFVDNRLEMECNGREVSEEKDKELQQRSKAGHEDISKAIDTGAFLLSEQALCRLKQYQKEAKEASYTTDWIEYLQGDLAATDSCLKEIIEIAKKDLRAK